jgi:hypothetical protein
MTRKIAFVLGRVRLTLAIFTIVLIVGIVVAAHGQGYWPVIVQRYGWDLITLQHGHIYAAWVGLLFSASLRDLVGILLLLLSTMGVLEYRRGTLLAAFGFLIIGPLASIITLMVLWPLGDIGIEYVQAPLLTPDVGSSTACLVCLGMFLIGEKGLWRNILLFGILALLGGLLFQESVYNIDHLSGYLIGMGTGAVIDWWKGRKHIGRALHGNDK